MNNVASVYVHRLSTLLVFLLLHLPIFLFAATIPVNCPSDSLQSAINLAQPGDTVQVSGSCSENILVRNEKQRISIDGGGSATITAATNLSPTFNVRGKGILIQGLTISGGSDGIEVNRGSNVVINNNEIK